MGEASEAAAAALIRLSELAEMSIETACAAPPALYVDPEILALEHQRIFAQDWLCAGRALDIPDTGDYLTFHLGAQPIFCVRGRDGAIRSFANICRHRMMRLLEEGRGCARRVVCPYHAWTYDLDGALIGAGRMERSAGFEKRAYGLASVRTEIWEGWIYVTLNADAAPLAETLAPLAALAAPYRMADYVPVLAEDHVWRTNWKTLTENFMEGYHLPVAHKATVGAWFADDTTEFPPEAHPAFTYQTNVKDADARYGVAHPSNTRFEGRARSRMLMPTVFPSHMYVLAPDHLWYLSLSPIGVGETRVRFGAALAPEVAADTGDAARRDALERFFAEVNAEDRFVVEGVTAMLRAPLAIPGPLSWLEREIHDFQRYLARRLGPDAA